MKFKSSYELENFLKEKLKKRKATSLGKMEGFKVSAVLIPLYLKNEEPFFLLTLRTSTVRDHKSQISFPGGTVSDKDFTLLHTALRETQEEVGIPSEEIRIVGELDEIFTVTYYRIKPFVGVIPVLQSIKPNPKEIEKVLFLPVSEFLKKENMRKEVKWEFLGKPYPVYYFDILGNNVWGATARIIKNFLEIVFGWKE